MMCDWDKFFLLALPTQIKATKNLSQSHSISFILTRLYTK